MVVTGYTLAFAGLLLSGGRSGDLLGRRRMFIIGVLVFAWAACSCSWSWASCSSRSH
jgi:MFS family permease